MIEKDNQFYILNLILKDKIESATFKKKSSKFILTLKKVNTESTWYSLKAEK
jgi:hypothetical protein